MSQRSLPPGSPCLPGEPSPSPGRRAPARETSLNGRTVVVTGASGFIGRHLLRRLEAERARIVLVRRPGAVSAPSRHRTVTCDLTEMRAAQSMLRRLRPDRVFHLAGFVSGDRSILSVSKALQSNLDSTSNLLLAAQDTVPFSRVIVASTLEVSNVWRNRLNLGSPYGISKAMVEVLAGGLRQQFGFDVVCARIGMAYGPDDPNERRLVPSVIKALLSDHAPVVGSGSRLCDWIYVEDVIEGLVRIARTRCQMPAGVDLGTGLLMPVGDVVERLRNIVGGAPPAQYTTQLNRPNEQERAGDTQSTQALLGWSPRTTLDEGLRLTVAWHRRHATREATGSPRRPEFPAPRLAST